MCDPAVLDFDNLSRIASVLRVRVRVRVLVCVCVSVLRIVAPDLRHFWVAILHNNTWSDQRSFLASNSCPCAGSTS